MPLPLKPGYNFNYDRIIRKPHYEMSAAEAYTDFYGIFYMVKGERLIHSPTFTTIVQTGEMVFIPKYIYRRTTYISNEPYERILLKFTDSMVSELFDTIGIENYQELCAERVIRFEKSTQENKLIILCLRERIIGDVNVGSLEKRHDCLANAIKYIKTHLHENLTLETVAHQVNISASYLSKIFINYLHTPFSAFVLNEKITYAQKLLSDSNLSITEIAVEAGFSSSAYFSDCFKRNTGMSPMQFRKSV